MRFSCHQIILREIDDQITEDELDEIICEVQKNKTENKIQTLQ